MPVFTDQTGRKIVLDKTPQRIISLVPSQTELLYDLGLENEVVGITKFCIHPHQWFSTKTRVGGTKRVKMDSIHRLQPDLIIANKEENVKEQIEELEKNYPVWVSDVNNLENAYKMIEETGSITKKEQQAGKIVLRIKEQFGNLKTRNPKPGTVYLIWQNPYMTVGSDTFIHSMLEAAGYENIYADKTRYPEVTIEEIKTLNPELLLLSSEPFPFKQKHIEEIKARGIKTQIVLADGELFSWYGSRMLKAAAYFKKLQDEIIVKR